MELAPLPVLHRDRGQQRDLCTIRSRHAVVRALGLSLQPIFESIGALTRQISALEHEIDRLAQEEYPQAQLLTQVPEAGEADGAGVRAHPGRSTALQRQPDGGRAPTSVGRRAAGNRGIGING